MVDQPQSPALQSALSKGAEIGLARAIRNAADTQALKDFIQARLGDLSDLDLAYIEGLADSILNSADYVESLSPDEDIDPDQIPTNPDLFSGDSSGKRLFWFGEWSIPGFDEVYQFSGTLPDITDFGDIASYAANLAASYVEAYPGRFAGADMLGDMTPSVRILGTEKAF
jgi:hypothetical protein